MSRSKNKSRHKWAAYFEKDGIRLQSCQKCQKQRSKGISAVVHYYDKKGNQLSTKAPECEN